MVTGPTALEATSVSTRPSSSSAQRPELALQRESAVPSVCYASFIPELAYVFVLNPRRVAGPCQPNCLHEPTEDYISLHYAQFAGRFNTAYPQRSALSGQLSAVSSQRSALSGLIPSDYVPDEVRPAARISEDMMKGLSRRRLGPRQVPTEVSRLAPLSSGGLVRVSARTIPSPRTVSVAGFVVGVPRCSTGAAMPTEGGGDQEVVQPVVVVDESVEVGEG